MRITLIGGSGFVGSRLIELLCESGADQYVLRNIDLRQSPFFPRLTQLGDVRDGAYMDSALKNTDCVVLLAAQHRDDVSPVSLYYDTNVDGMKRTLHAMEQNGVKRLVFYSSVAVYGLNKKDPDENHPADPFNHYGKSKWMAEEVLQEWFKTHSDWSVSIVRPTVIFGERNRGNVYNLLRQISSGKFLMVGRGENKKSMAYVGNIVAFTKYLIDRGEAGYQVYNYVDKPDYTMNELVGHVSRVLRKHIPTTHFPYWLGMLGGYGFDILAKLTGKKLTVSSVRVKKFCATTQFNADKLHRTGFKAPYTLAEGLARTLEFEFIHDASAGVTFKTE